MRRNNHNNRRKTSTGLKGDARTAPQACAAEPREAMQHGLRILARIIARAHMRREALRGAQEPAVPPQAKGTSG